MMLGYKKLGMVLAAAALLALVPAKAEAQFVRYSPIFWSFEASGGVTIPLGGLSDAAKIGWNAGIGASYFLNPRFALKVEGSLDGHKGETAVGGTAPDDIRVWHYLAGIEYHLTDPTSNFMFNFTILGGGATFDSDRFVVDDFPTAGATTSTEFDQTVWAVNGGLQAGYSFSQHSGNPINMVTLFIAADINVMFVSKSDTEALAALYGRTPWSTTLSVPISGGFRINVP